MLRKMHARVMTPGSEHHDALPTPQARRWLAGTRGWHNKARVRSVSE